ncbi:hypothetical protein HMI56_005576 [Coelomomyces lativittatus]|nr:hypothetical protein HMI56_005576 [Coelomomyces lativittatus]
MWSSFPENILQFYNTTKHLLTITIPAPVKHQECSFLKNALLPFQRTYFDLTLALGYMNYGLKDEYIEHYIADIGNMLQLFYKYGNVMDTNFQLYAAFYVSSTHPLTSITLDYEKTFLGSHLNEANLNQSLKVVDMHLGNVLDLWEKENKKPPFFFKTSVHPQVYLKPESRQIYERGIEGIARNGFALNKRQSEGVERHAPYSSVVSISNFQLFDFYHLAFHLGHELMHNFGVVHDEENVICQTTPGAMTDKGKWEWKKFTFCNAESMQWAKYYTKSTIDELSHFYYEGDEIE